MLKGVLNVSYVDVQGFFRVNMKWDIYCDLCWNVLLNQWVHG